MLIFNRFWRQCLSTFIPKVWSLSALLLLQMYDEYKLWSQRFYTTPVFALIFSPTCPKAKLRKMFYLFNKFFHNFHLSKSSFTCPGFRASVLVRRLLHSSLKSFYTCFLSHRQRRFRHINGGVFICRKSEFGLCDLILALVVLLLEDSSVHGENHRLVVSY